VQPRDDCSPAPGAGLAAAALSVRTARGCQAGQRWAGWAALLIGAASAPQAAASGFHGPYTIPDTATAALGVLLTVAVLATAGRAGPPGHATENSCVTTGDHPVTRRAAAPAPAHDAPNAIADAGPAATGPARFLTWTIHLMKWCASDKHPEQ
jgi:hypothetical protein